MTARREREKPAPVTETQKQANGIRWQELEDSGVTFSAIETVGISWKDLDRTDVAREKLEI